MKNILRLSYKPVPNQFTYKVRVKVGETTTPKFIFAAGYPPAYIDWGDGTTRTAVTSATEYTHTYTATGEYTVILILANQAKWLTQVDINSDKVISVVTPIQIFAKLSVFVANINAAWLQNISNWILPTTATNFTVNLNASLSGNVSGWILPTSLIILNLRTTALSGDISNWTLPVIMTSFSIFATIFSGCPILSSMVAIQTIRADDCALPEATVDAYLNGCWLREPFTTFATPTLNLGGTDAPPSVAGAAIALLLIGAGWIVTTS